MGGATPAWHARGMTGRSQDAQLNHRLLDSLYAEAMVLADEARGYFDEAGRAERDALDPLVRVSFSCESLKVTTRLMHVIAWLLTQRAVQTGQLPARDALDPSRRLGDAPVTEAGLLAILPPKARSLIQSSTDLHRRIARLDIAQDMPATVDSPVRSLQRRLASMF
jgi:regulator of CtrA degradation